MALVGVASNLIAKALESLGKVAFKKAASWWGVIDDLKKLRKTMEIIQARVRDAERRQEEEKSDLIKAWLCRLKQVLYRADDLFDEVLTLDHQKKFTESSSMLAKVDILSSRKLANKIKSIRKELDVIKSDMDVLNLRVIAEDLILPMDSLMQRRETASFVKVEDVIGRENDINMIIEMLFDDKYDEERVTVIPIVGFGGIGKTTLAQYIFNDESVQMGFDLFSWVCIPEVDNQKAIFRKVYRSFNGEDFGDYSLDQIKSRIKDSVKDLKYLLVLDDVWDESRHRWLELQSLLECGGFGSKIIVTTRSDVVAKNVGTIPKAYKLGLLTDNESWNLFTRLAFKPGQEESNPSLIQIGQKIVKSCGNVPLAIRVVGSLLYSKDSEKEWKFFEEDHLSKGKLVKDGNIMPVLKLSYDYLAPTLKQCFSYCSLFPKDYEFSKVALVHLWMAQGYIEPSTKDIGDHYFMELLGRNFFQDPEEDDEGNVKKCKMHDLVHDLAQHLASDESKLLVKSSMENSDGLIHASINFPDFDTRDEDGGWEVPTSLLDAKKMRSLLFRSNSNSMCPIKVSSLEKMVSRFKSLRALELKDMKILMVPNNIEKLRHLRYLNLEGNNIVCLPSTITKLENLQTLNLDSCVCLTELPRDFPKLAKLRHLVVYWGSLTDLPSGFGDMTSLHELHKFVVGEGRNTGIDSLPALNLRGKLEIQFRKLHLNAVLEAQGASLKDNQELDNLILDFRFEEVGEDDTSTFGEMDEMLMCLKLPQNLKQLKVVGYRGHKIPSRWLDGFSKLVSIRIDKCTTCTILPRFSQLPCLKFLYLGDLDVLEYIEDALDGLEYMNDEVDMSASAHTYFPSLVDLELVNLRQLKGWTRPSNNDDEQRQLLFPRLLVMKVNGCQQLKSMPQAPKLESLEVKRIMWEPLKSKVMSLHDQESSSSSSSSSLSTLFTSLKYLRVFQVQEELELLSISNRLCHLHTVLLSFCNGLQSLTFESPNSIQHLDIRWCKNLRNISDGLQHLCALEKLEIRCCENLEERKEEGMISNNWHDLRSLRALHLLTIPKFEMLPQGIASLTTLKLLSITELNNLTELPDEIGNLTLLHDFWISRCPKLTLLPPSIQRLTSLQKLRIRGCPGLTQRCKKPNGEDWHLIQHIPHVDIEG